MVGNLTQRTKAWIRPHACVSLRPDGSPCKNVVASPNTRCETCWVGLAASPNGLLRVSAATELGTVAGVNAEAYGRLINDPVTAVRLAVLEHSPQLSSGWQEHMADDPEPVVWRALAQRKDITNAAATKLLSNKDDFTFGYLLENSHCPVSVVRWIANHHTGPIAAEAKRKLDEPLTPKLARQNLSSQNLSPYNPSPYNPGDMKP